jgi:hypothetical protein
MRASSEAVMGSPWISTGAASALPHRQNDVPSSVVNRTTFGTGSRSGLVLLAAGRRVTSELAASALPRRGQ